MGETWKWKSSTFLCNNHLWFSGGRNFGIYWGERRIPSFPLYLSSSIRVISDMDCALKLASPSICSLPRISPTHDQFLKQSRFLPEIGYGNRVDRLGFGSLISSLSNRMVVCPVGNVHKRISSLESLFCYDKPIPEEIIEKPVGTSLAEKNIGGNPRCPSCEAKGAILCTTCSGSGLYVDSILESQGIIVKVRCLGSGGNWEYYVFRLWRQGSYLRCNCCEVCFLLSCCV